MPISLAQVAANTATVTVTVGAESASIVYYPGRVTEKAITTLTAFTQVQQGAAPADVEATFSDFNEMLCNLIASWDVFEDDAQTVPFPVDVARFKELPFSFRMHILTAIMQDMRPEVEAA